MALLVEGDSLCCFGLCGYRVPCTWWGGAPVLLSKAGAHLPVLLSKVDVNAAAVSRVATLIDRCLQHLERHAVAAP